MTALNQRETGHPSSPLNTHEYDRMLEVLNDCASARTVDSFHEAVMTSLSRHFGYRTATVFSGPSFSALFADPKPLHIGHAVSMFPEYHAYWFRDDFFAMPQSLRCLQSTRVSSLSELQPSAPPKTQRFLADFFIRGGLTSAVGLYLQVSENQNSFVGLFGNDDPAKEQRDAYILRRMAEPLNAISRSMSPAPADCRPDAVGNLTPRQREVAMLIAEGLTNAAIAELLVLREDTVKKYVSGILATLKCHSRTQVALLISESRSTPLGLRPETLCLSS